MSGWGLSPGLERLARLIILPFSAAWAVGNRFNLIPEAPVGTSPFLDPEALRRWRQIISEANVYLEYGSGGSTFEATQSVPLVISTETDRRYLSTVELKISASNSSTASFHPIHVDIGWTERWAAPSVLEIAIKAASMAGLYARPMGQAHSIGIGTRFHLCGRAISGGQHPPVIFAVAGRVELPIHAGRFCAAP